MINKVINISVEKTQRVGEVRLQIDFEDDYHYCKIIQLSCNISALFFSLVDCEKIITTNRSRQDEPRLL